MSGYIWLKKNRSGKSWHARWYRKEKDASGNTVKVQHSEKLVDFSDRYRRRKDAQPLLDAKSRERCATCHEMKSKHEKAKHEFVLDESLPKWRGWYACRRGCATLATSLDSALAAKSLCATKTSRQRRLTILKASPPKRSAQLIKSTACSIIRTHPVGLTRGTLRRCRIPSERAWE